MASTAESSINLSRKEELLAYFKRLWAYRYNLVVEPFYFFYNMSFILNTVALNNFPLEKACRVNLGFNEIVCNKILNKGDIDCGMIKSENFDTTTIPELLNITNYDLKFNDIVCIAEIEAQKLNAKVSGIRGPLSLLISAIFLDEIPMEFGGYIESIVPAVFGGSTLIFMAAFSYITISTPENDRVFRFGVFCTFFSTIPMIGEPLSGPLFELLRYKLSFCLAIVLQLIAILYIIIYIKEIKPGDIIDRNASKDIELSSKKIDTVGVENSGYEQTQFDVIQKTVTTDETSEIKKQKTPKESAEAKKLGFWRKFFDIKLARDVLTLPLIERKNNDRMLICLLILADFLSLVPDSSESEYFYNYTLKKLNWNGTIYTIFDSIISGIIALATFIGTAVFSKILKFPDSIIGMMSVVLSSFSRFILAFAKDTATVFVAGVVDMFITLRVIAIKSIGSSIVASDEISKLYTFFSLNLSISQLIFSPLYSFVYKATIETFPGAIFILSQIFCIPNILLFIFFYFHLRRNTNSEKKEPIENGEDGNSPAYGQTNPDAKFSSL